MKHVETNFSLVAEQVDPLVNVSVHNNMRANSFIPKKQQND